ncbi:hypothetical protein D3C78_1989330 [compost metagenome]
MRATCPVEEASAIEAAEPDIPIRIIMHNKTMENVLLACAAHTIELDIAFIFLHSPSRATTIKPAGG